MEALGAFVAIAWLFLVVLAILWIAMPFAIFGTKPSQASTDRGWRSATQLGAVLDPIAVREDVCVSPDLATDRSVRRPWCTRAFWKARPFSH